MSLQGKKEFQQEINSPGNVFLEIYGTKKANLPKVCPNTVPSINLVNGNWGEVGCHIIVHYFVEGKGLISEEMVVDVDEENKSITYNLFGGDLMKLYKTMKVIVQAVSRGEKNFMKYTYEYETLNPDVSAPEMLKGFISEITSTIDAHYMKLMEDSNA